MAFLLLSDLAALVPNTSFQSGASDYWFMGFTGLLSNQGEKV